MIDTFPTIDKEQPRLYSMTSGSMASFLYNRIYDVVGEFVESHNTRIIVGASLVDAPSLWMPHHCGCPIIVNAPSL